MSQQQFSRELNLTRPADIIAYTAGDVIGSSISAGGAVLSFASNGGSPSNFTITGSDLRVDLAAVPATMTSFRLQLYRTTPPSALGDNAPWDLVAGDAAAYIGFVDLGSPVDVGSLLYVQATSLNKELRIGENQTLFAYLQTIGGFTPTSAATLSVALHARGF